MYDGVMEFWVTVRETGAYEEEHEMQEKKRSLSKASFLRYCLEFSILFQN